MPENLHAVVTEHTIHRDYCPKCKKHVEPVMPDALPNAAFGHRLIGFTSWCHYGLGVTLDQLVDILQYHLQLRLSAGGLIAAWQRLAEILTPWYQQIAEEAKQSAYLHADHAAWRALAKTLRRLIRDGIRLRKRPDFAPRKCRSRILRLGWRLDALIAAESDDADARRLRKRLRRTCDHIFTFLDYPQIAYENNFAERQIRPTVILRKNSQSNRSDRGAGTQAVLMSIYRTLRLRGADPLQTIAEAPRSYLHTSRLPPLPRPAIADG